MYPLTKSLPHPPLDAVPDGGPRGGNADDDTEALLERLATEPDPRDSERIVEQLVQRYLGLVNAIASHYHSRGIEWDDLVQVGRFGLCKAIRHYRADRGTNFHAYAVPTISGEIKRHFRDHVWDLRPPRRLQELQLDLRVREEQLEQQFGHPPTDSELAADMGVEGGTLREARIASRMTSTVSIDASTTANVHDMWSERLGSEEGAYGAVEARILLRPALKTLAPRERRIIYLRFIRGWTQQEIGESLGVSQMQVSRLLNRILRKLRAHVEPQWRAG